MTLLFVVGSSAVVFVGRDEGKTVVAQKSALIFGRCYLNLRMNEYFPKLAVH